MDFDVDEHSSDISPPMSQNLIPRYFEPCDATSADILYANGCQVVIAHHDTLKISRIFTTHQAIVRLLVVNNCSHRDAGRFVMSYDAEKTAIVWNIQTEEEIARFTSYEDLNVAAWTRNDNVVFGNDQGSVILFDPDSSTHTATRTIDDVPITAIAPAADCSTYALGYQNGTILIATLQPEFTIIYNLSPSQVPSPVVTLAWHASSPRQRSDMLATQTDDGDTRIWSIAKPADNCDAAKVVRILKQHNDSCGPNWLGWSKNGRVIQYCHGLCKSWDVRTKDVSYESVPVLSRTRGIALYGPTATLFVLGEHNTVQQYDLNSPPVLVCDVQHPGPKLPPTPPACREEQTAMANCGLRSLTSVPINIDAVSESDEDHLSPLARIIKDTSKGYGQIDSSSNIQAGLSNSSSTSIPSTRSRNHRRQNSVISHDISGHTSISSSRHATDSLPASQSGSRDDVSRGRSTSGYSNTYRGRSSLRSQVTRDSNDRMVVELFKHTRARLDELPYSRPQYTHNSRSSVEHLRKDMIHVIFGFDGDAADVIRHEISKHRVGTASHILLKKWMGDLDADVMTSSSELMTSADWMLLALSGIGGQASQHKIARVYVERLLEKGDIHTAATIMLGMGDQNEAIRIYASHRRFMEALLLTAYVFPDDWTRQISLIRRWGEWAVQHGYHQLAIRCFSCTSSEIGESDGSNTVMIERDNGRAALLRPMSPPLSPASVVPRGPHRSIAKSAALKLVTTFDTKHGNEKHFTEPLRSAHTSDMVATPIAESAIDMPRHEHFAHDGLKSSKSRYNTPASARTATPGAYTRARLPSIGETPTDVPVDLKQTASSLNSTDDDLSEVSLGTIASHDSRRRRGRKASVKGRPPVSHHSSKHDADRHTISSPFEKSSAHDNLSQCSVSSSQLSPTTTNASASDLSSSDIEEARYQMSKKAQVSSSYSDYTPRMSHTAQQSTVLESKKELLVTPSKSSSLDPFISSLEVAKYRSKRKRSRDGSHDVFTDTLIKRSNVPRSARSRSRDRGRTHGRSAIFGGRDTSGSPMVTTPYDTSSSKSELPTMRDPSKNSTRRKPRDASHCSETTIVATSRNASRVRGTRSRNMSIDTSGAASTNHNAGTLSVEELSVQDLQIRARSRSRGDIAPHSPTSPVAVSSDSFYTSHKPARSVNDPTHTTARNEYASGKDSTSQLDITCDPVTQFSTNGEGPVMTFTRDNKTQPHDLRRPDQKSSESDLKAGDLIRMRINRQLNKEAARELEDRRESLVRRPSVPPIIYPHELSPRSYKPPSTKDGSYIDGFLPERSHTVSPEEMRMASSRFQEPTGSPQRRVTPIGLPATPKVMQHLKYDPDNKFRVQVQADYHNGVSPPRFRMASLDQIATSAIESKGNGAEDCSTTEDTLQSLPRTTYQRAARGIARSMSAPTPEETTFFPTNPARQMGCHTNLASSNLRTSNILQASPIAESMSAADNMAPLPPPPPPAPPLLPQLQHLAMPPPPPPPPMRAHGSRSIPVYVASAGPALVEIVANESDDEDDSSDDENEDDTRSKRSSKDSIANTLHRSSTAPAPLFTAEKERIRAELLSAKETSNVPTSVHRPLHTRSRSSADKFASPLHTANLATTNNSQIPPSSAISTISSNSLSQRFSRATERLRTASRGAIALDTSSNSHAISPGGMIRRTISPPVEGKGTGISPYESLCQSVYHRLETFQHGDTSRNGTVNDTVAHVTKNGSGMI